MGDIGKEIEQKYGREAYVNMDRLATFMVKMIRKYGSEVLEEIESEEKKKSDIEKREWQLQKSCHFCCNEIDGVV